VGLKGDKITKKWRIFHLSGNANAFLAKCFNLAIINPYFSCDLLVIIIACIRCVCVPVDSCYTKLCCLIKYMLHVFVVRQ
jgi:hypothetical protein